MVLDAARLQDAAVSSGGAGAGKALAIARPAGAQRPADFFRAFIDLVHRRTGLHQQQRFGVDITICVQILCGQLVGPVEPQGLHQPAVFHDIDRRRRPARSDRPHRYLILSGFPEQFQDGFRHAFQMRPAIFLVAIDQLDPALEITFRGLVIVGPDLLAEIHDPRHQASPTSWSPA